MRVCSSLIARWLEPFGFALWGIFVAVTLAIVGIWTGVFDESRLASWSGNSALRDALLWLVAHADFAWITLATANIYITLAQTEGLPTARRWALIVGGGVLALGAASVFTGIPLGAIRYSGHLGVKLGPAPIGLAFLWFAIILGARETMLRIAPRSSHAALALGTGALTFLTDLNLEPLAAKLRGWWFWRAAILADPPRFTPPLSNDLAWLAAGAALTFFLREDHVSDTQSRPWKPTAVFVILNAVFLLAHVGRWLRA